jgi:hypothetical protein
MPVTGSTVRVQGLRDLTTAFGNLDKNTSKELRTELRTAAEPVKQDAQMLSHTIRRIGPSWSQMRVGVTKSTVYVAPKQRSRNRGNPRFKRRNLATLLLDRALIPALDRNVDNTIRRVDALMQRLGRDWGKGG